MDHKREPKSKQQGWTACIIKVLVRISTTNLVPFAKMVSLEQKSTSGPRAKLVWSMLFYALHSMEIA